ncbi:hypothetical protein LTR70_008555 [Exophiala xenobiotica]|uniref:AA9 family lytic polysaccharide monooxygenase n=1 Tax=Lithohypha guttulata TaxID=1690604 RepID=A0ABR0K172_9EURO|nr:hypothetical protein LTR24_008183 [Lithohypha guttulata]KAK5311829.1 hypothetical protein LTR70_008555 [Exophiala xenobiotica]
MQWNHNIGGPTAGDGDDPIASSHKGPVMVYMAKVDDASTADGSDLKWFKVAEEGLDTSTGKWGVDTLIANAGLWSFTMPSLAAGEYLLRGEVLALHSAGSQGEAQFYMSCAGIKVTGSGTCSPSDTVSFPGAYSATDPGILISIYGGTGQPDNGGKAYTAPGPPVAKCDGSAPAASSSSAASSAASSSASVSVSATVTTANNAASSTTTTTTSEAAESSSSDLATSATSSSISTTTPQSALPTALSTVTGRPANNATLPWQSKTRSQPANTRTSRFSPSASGQPATETSTSTRGHSNGNGNGNANGNGNGNGKGNSSLTLTASATETGVKIPSTSASASAISADDTNSASATATATGTSPATPSASGTGFPMTGPNGKKFVCYEVMDF